MNKSLVKQSEKRTILHIELLLNKTIQYRYYLVEAYVRASYMTKLVFIGLNICILLHNIFGPTFYMYLV